MMPALGTESRGDAVINPSAAKGRYLAAILGLIYEKRKALISGDPAFVPKPTILGDTMLCYLLANKFLS
ncbi:MAG TPA: hypothetical protein VE959_38250 [Bryobacteraceae bacterium]|nr:hypothetical protein [Bryobacteraceae bacterium]